VLFRSYMKFKESEMPVIEHDFYGRWDQYIIFLENLAKSIRENSDDKTEMRKKFFRWHSTYDERRNLNMYEVFPEYEEFFNMCKSL